MNIVAEYIINQYTITFDSDGGSPTTTVITGDFGTSFMAPIVTKTWYTFSWWNQIVPATIQPEDQTFVALWNIESYLVTFEDRDGTLLSTGIVDHNAPATAPSNPTRTWYTFSWWDMIFDVITSSITVRAEYTLDPVVTPPSVSGPGGFAGWGATTSTIATPDQTGQPTTPQTEQETAYERAYRHGITTLYPIDQANLKRSITRWELSKMVSVYATMILAQNNRITHPWCIQFADSDHVNNELAGYMTQACQLWVMWLQADGKTPLIDFNPNDIVTRAQFATVLSRLLYGDTYNNSDDASYWSAHINALKNNEILTQTNPSIIELRWWIIMMLYRTQS
jgi:hypothetical protein